MPAKGWMVYYWKESIWAISCLFPYEYYFLFNGQAFKHSKHVYMPWSSTAAVFSNVSKE